jgi:hypothetical protein
MKLRVLSKKTFYKNGTWTSTFKKSGIPQEDWDSLTTEWFKYHSSDAYEFYRKEVVPKYTKLAMYLRGF